MVVGHDPSTAGVHGRAHAHVHAGGTDPRRRLAATLALVTGTMIAEVVGGYLSGSLALLADAGHMLSDAGALVVALVAMTIARRPASRSHTFGYQRAEILGALLNGAVLLVVAGMIVVEAFRRIAAPPHVHGVVMLAVAAFGLGVNLLGLWMLREGRDGSLNMRGVWLHVLADALGSVGAIVAGALVAGVGWTWADPVASVIIAVLITYSSWSLLRATVAVLMQAAPAHVDVDALEDALVAIDGVVAAHDVHVWSVTSGRDVMSAHLTLEPSADRRAVLDAVQRGLRDRFDLQHSTVQLDCPDPCSACRP